MQGKCKCIIYIMIYVQYYQIVNTEYSYLLKSQRCSEGTDEVSVQLLYLSSWQSFEATSNVQPKDTNDLWPRTALRAPETRITFAPMSPATEGSKA